jgi:2'-phosphotransferase
MATMADSKTSGDVSAPPPDPLQAKGSTTTNSDSSKSEKTRKGHHKKLSHALSRILRHAAPDYGLVLTPDGYVPVEEILACGDPKLKNATVQDVIEVVNENDKQRFKIITRDNVLCIRANQGHSIQGIDPELLLRKLSKEELTQLSTIVHGTFVEPYNKHIKTEGLSRMSRTHIHFAKGLPNDGKNQVISGMRKSCQIYVFVDGAKCAHDNIEFFESDNGVLLTAGVESSGILPVKYFSHVTGSSGKILLDQRRKSGDALTDGVPKGSGDEQVG